MHTMLTRHWSVIAALGLAALFGAIAAGPTAAQAASLTTALCPATIAPVSGVAGDHTTIGLDDGKSGVEYEPGELVVILQPGRTAADIRCLAHELRAVVIDGGAGKRGLGGIPNAVVLQLQPRVSLQQTARQLLSPRYAKLILTATPNEIATLDREDAVKDPTVNDPLFPVEWGLSNAGSIPKTSIDPFPERGYGGMLIPNAFSGATRMGIRVRQAWGLLSRRTIAAPKEVKVAIIDDSLIRHPDLEANVAMSGSARYTGASVGTRIELLKPAGSSEVQITDTWGIKRDVCPISWDMGQSPPRIDTEAIARRLATQSKKMCASKQLPVTWQMTIDHAKTGTVTFSFNGSQTTPIDLSELWNPAANETEAQTTARYDGVASAIQTALLAIVPGGRFNTSLVDVVIRPPSDATRATGKQEIRIVFHGPEGKLELDATGLRNPWRVAGRISQSDAREASGPVGLSSVAKGGTFQIRYSVTIANLPNEPAPVTYTVTSDPIGEGATAADVETSLANAIPAAAAGSIGYFRVEAVPGQPRTFFVDVYRPVADVADISNESLTVVNPNGITSPAPVAKLTAYTPTAVIAHSAGGVTTLTLRGMPPIRHYAPVNKDIAIGVQATEDAVTTSFGRWPGPWEAGDSHGQFIAGVIGATAGNGTGMAGTIGDQVANKTNIELYGVVTDLTKNGLLNMLEYASGVLNAHVVNYSMGNRGTGPDLFEEDVRLSKRDDVLRSEDPLPAVPESMLMGGVGEASRTLFVLASGNDGADIRRPAASIAAVRKRIRNDVPEKVKAANPNATKAEIDAAVKRALDRVGHAVGIAPCRPKGMGIRQRPLGIGARASTKGGTLSMLQMPDGTYDRGNILCVASADWNGNLSTFSNWGPGLVDVAAPGESIVGTTPDGGYSTADGTSFAAPIVAGVAAMVYSVLPNAQPWLVKCAILSSATSRPLRAPNPYKAPFTYLTEDVSAFDPPVVPYPHNSPLTVNGMVQASEAMDAAIYLDNRVRLAENGTRSWPTCVQKRGFFGGWKNTPVLK